ncbi:SH3 domain-containing protein [Streptomyces sp. NPDC006339]|uniref:SH3 domain-containing protein n=1 Tax=Streptomyces sp. NPDC006339 TaxID=3156755 RepID=UPI0033B8BF4C
MRKILYSAAVAAALLAPAAPAVAQQHSVPATIPASTCGYDITGDSVHLRSGAGARYASLGHLRKGDDVDVLAERGGWVKVRLDGRSASGIKDGTVGWVARKYVQPSVCMRLNG